MLPVVVVFGVSTAPVAEQPAMASAAAVVGAVHPVVVSSRFSSNSEQSAEALCGPGQVVVGGGARVIEDGFKPPSHQLVLTRLEPSDRITTPTGLRHGYQVTAAETSTGTTNLWRVEATAICAQRADGAHIVPRSTGSSSQPVQSVAAPCPAGEVVLGSGARINNASGLQVALQVARPSGPGDISRAQAGEDRDGFNGSWSLVAFAICAPEPKGYGVRFGQSVDIGTYPPRKGAARFCDAGERALGPGGAVGFDAPGSVTLTEIRPVPGMEGAQAVATENSPVATDWGFIVATVVCID